jgi:hypothetical protein
VRNLLNIQVTLVIRGVCVPTNSRVYENADNGYRITCPWIFEWYTMKGLDL